MEVASHDKTVREEELIHEDGERIVGGGKIVAHEEFVLQLHASVEDAYRLMNSNLKREINDINTASWRAPCLDAQSACGRP